MQPSFTMARKLLLFVHTNGRSSLRNATAGQQAPRVKVLQGRS